MSDIGILEICSFMQKYVHSCKHPSLFYRLHNSKQTRPVLHSKIRVDQLETSDFATTSVGWFMPLEEKTQPSSPRLKTNTWASRRANDTPVALPGRKTFTPVSNSYHVERNRSVTKRSRRRCFLPFHRHRYPTLYSSEATSRGISYLSLCCVPTSRKNANVGDKMRDYMTNQTPFLNATWHFRLVIIL